MQRNVKTSERAHRIKEAIQSSDKTTTWASKKSEKPLPRVGLLYRVSSLKQEKDGTIDQQRVTCRRLYLEHFDGEPHELVGEYSDEAYNLEYKDLNRDFWRLMADIKSGKVNTVITVHIDRIFRGATKQLNGEISDIFTLAKLTLITTSQKKQYDPTDITSRMVDGFLQELGPTAKLDMVAKLQTSRRKVLTKDEKWRLSIVPYGYRVKVLGTGKNKSYVYSIVEDEAEIVRDIYRLYVGDKTKILPNSDIEAPMGVKRISQYLNDLKIDRSAWLASIPEGHQATNRWLGPSINRMIRNPMYKGDMVVMFGETRPGSAYTADAVVQKIDVPAIIESDLFERVQRLREKKATECYDIMQTGAQHKNWLHRKIRCPSCGFLMRGFTSCHKDRYYGCSNAGKTNGTGQHKTFRAVDIEELLGSYLMEKLGQGLLYRDLFRGLSAVDDSHHRLTQILKDLDFTKEKKSKSDTELTKLTEYLLKGIIDQDQYIAHKERISTEKASDDEKIKKLANEAAFLQSKKNDVVEVIDDLKEKFETSLRSDSDFMLDILRETTAELINFVELKEFSFDLENMELAQIFQSYHQGLIVPKQLLDIGWNTRQIYKFLGKSGRKAAANFEIIIHWITGEKTTLDPRNMNLESIPIFDPERAKIQRVRRTETEKKDIVLQLLRGSKATELARKYGINETVLSTWKRQYKQELLGQLDSPLEESIKHSTEEDSSKSKRMSYRKWPDEMKKVIVSEILNGTPATVVAAKYRIAPSVLSGWKKDDSRI